MNYNILELLVLPSSTAPIRTLVKPQLICCVVFFSFFFLEIQQLQLTTRGGGYLNASSPNKGENIVALHYKALDSWFVFLACLRVKSFIFRKWTKDASCLFDMNWNLPQLTHMCKLGFFFYTLNTTNQMVKTTNNPN